MSTRKLKSTSPSLKSTSPSLKSISPPLISNWIKKHSKSRGGRLYFYNVVTGVSTWTKPDELIKDEARMKALDSESPKKPCLKRKAIQQNSSPEKKQKSQNELSKKQSTISRCESNAPNKDPMLQLEQRLSTRPMKISPHNTREMDAHPMPESDIAKCQTDVRNRKMIKPSKIKYINKSSIQQNESKNYNGLCDNKPAANRDTSGTFCQGEKNLSNTNTKHTVTNGTFSQGEKKLSNTGTKHTVTSGTFSQGEKKLSNTKHTDKASNKSYTSQKKTHKKARHNKQVTGVTVHKQDTGGTVHNQSQRLQAEDDFILPEKSISKNISSSQAKNILPIKSQPVPEKRDTSGACAHIFKSNRTDQKRINDNTIKAHNIIPQADIFPFKRCASLAQASKQINKVQGAGGLAVPVLNEQVSLARGKPPSGHSRYDSDDTRHTKCAANTASLQNKEDFLQFCAKRQIENLATRKPQREEIFSSNQTYGDHLECANLIQNNASQFQHTASEIQGTQNCSGPPSDPTIDQRHNVKTHGSILHKIVAENKIISSNAVEDDHFESVNQPNNNISRFELITHKYPPGSYDFNSSEIQQSKSSIDTFLQTGTFPFKNQTCFEDSNEPHLAAVCQAQDTTTVYKAQDTTAVYKAQVTTAGENFTEDDYMDVDEEEILCNLQDVRNQTSNILEQPSGTLTEMVFNTNNNLSQASVVDTTSYSPIQAVVFVIDTNVLISNLQFFDNLITTTVPGYGALRLVLPWAVMQELDYLKNGKSSVNNSPIAKKAAAAVRLIHRYLSSQNSKLVGQTPHEASEPTNLPFHSNDDRILQCCLQCEKKYPSSMVMLVTRDINLINKAIIMGIKAASTDVTILFK
ncbi:unnamed protein product [Lymnaea stagnalis]|uniref:WW domain-containing protein n=1 Tax=Lymnaea stagnalis TaxID=6523 RepID=A0AAV2HA56_LYMST